MMGRMGPYIALCCLLAVTVLSKDVDRCDNVLHNPCNGDYYCDNNTGLCQHCLSLCTRNESKLDVTSCSDFCQENIHPDNKTDKMPKSKDQPSTLLLSLATTGAVLLIFLVLGIAFIIRYRTKHKRVSHDRDEECLLVEGDDENECNQNNKLEDIHIHYKDFCNKLETHGIPSYINEQKMEGETIEVIVDQGTEKKCKQFLSEVFENLYNKGIFKVVEVPWEMWGKECGHSFVKTGDNCTSQNTLSPGSNIFQVPTEQTVTITLTGQIPDKVDIKCGTIGCFLKDQHYNIYALTSQHVMKSDKFGFNSDYNKSNPDSLSDKTAMSQRNRVDANDDGPTMLILGKDQTGVQSEDYSYIKTSQRSNSTGEDRNYVLYDIAVVELTNEGSLLCQPFFQPLHWEDGHMGTDVELFTDSDNELHEDILVQKIGATTGYTVGKIYKVDEGEKDDPSQMISKGSFLVKPINEAHFASHGDSGSLVTTTNTGKRKVLGIVKGGNCYGKTICVNFKSNFEKLQSKMREFDRDLDFLQEDHMDSVKARYSRVSSASSYDSGRFSVDSLNL